MALVVYCLLVLETVDVVLGTVVEEVEVVVDDTDFGGTVGAGWWDNSYYLPLCVPLLHLHSSKYVGDTS